MAKKHKKVNLGSTESGDFVYSTNKNFAFSGLADLLGKEHNEDKADVLEVHLEKKHRGGKTAVLIKGFSGNEVALADLAKKLKTALGVGGSAKNGEIVIQGDKRDAVMQKLVDLGYKTKRIGG